MSKPLLFAFSLLLAMVAPSHATDAFEAGKHYFLIEPAQPSIASAGKVEVTEVFSYGCPACYQFNATAKKLQAALPPNAEFHYVPASFRPDEKWPLFQRAYYAAQILGVAEKGHDAMFQAIWGGGPLAIRDAGNKPLDPTIEDVAKFYADFGAKPDEFVAVANSFGVNTKMRQADAYVKSHQIDSTPSIVVAGKYRMTAGSAGGYDQLIELVKFLVQKESTGH